MSNHDIRRFCLIALFLLAESSPALALEWRTGSVSCRVGATRHPAAYAAGSPLAANSWNLGNFLSSGGRTRVVQICAVAMCITLFIMMRKLNG